MQHSLSTSTSSSQDRLVNVARSILEESSSNHHDGIIKSGSAGSQPNFSLIKGKINLDNLFIRELHETFKATFGRETSLIKDIASITAILRPTSGVHSFDFITSIYHSSLIVLFYVSSKTFFLFSFGDGGDWWVHVGSL